MKCPRCGNEWDTSKSSCAKCGFAIRMTGQAGSMTRAIDPQRRNVQSAGWPTTGQLSGKLPVVEPQLSEIPVAHPVQSPRTARPQALNGSLPIPPRNATLAPNPPFAAPPSLAKPAFEKNVLRKVPPGREATLGQPVPHTDAPSTDLFLAKNPSTDHLQQNALRSQMLASTSRTSGLAGDAQTKDEQQGQPSSLSQPLRTTPSPLKSTSVPVNTRPLLPGVLLRGGRYRLQELRERQEWGSGVFEANWIGQDAHRSAAQVMICEVVLPENTSATTKNILRTATVTLAAVGRHPRIPTLLDAFSDQGRSFFIFEPVKGEPLLSRMRRSGRALSEHDVIECCLQMTDVLEYLAQQSPPLVHGLIRPEHIIVSRNESHYMLTNFSVVLAGGAAQFVSAMERSHLSPYTAPEVARGVIDVRTELFSLLATAYHTVTGSVPISMGGGVPSTMRVSANVSAAFDAILAKGLVSVANQRYQRPSELRQDLLAVRSVSGSIIPEPGLQEIRNNANAGSTFPTNSPLMAGGPMVSARENKATSENRTRVAEGSRLVEKTGARYATDTVAETLPILLASAASEDVEGAKQLLPRPEELPPMPVSNDRVNALYWLSGILVCLILIVVLSHVLG